MIKYFALSLFLLAFGSCKHPDISLQNPNDLLRPAAEFAHNNFQFSLFYAAIAKAGLVDELNGKGPFTVFAPGNLAFNEIGIKTPADLDQMDKESLKALVHLHVLNQKLYAEDVPLPSLDQKYTSASGAELFLARFSAYYGLYINGATSPSNKTNIRLSNGIFHEINKVLKYNAGTVQSWLERQKQYSILVAGFKKFGYWEQLAKDGQWTVLAPTDDAFKKAGITKESIEALNPSKYGRRLFGSYIFSVRFFTTDLNFYPSSGDWNSYYTKSGAGFRLPIGGDETFSNGISDKKFFVIPTLPLNGNTPVKVVEDFSLYPSRSDFVNRNGVVHELTDILLLPENALIN